MFRLVFFLVFLNTVWGDNMDEEIVEHCGKLYNEGSKCCKWEISHETETKYEAIMKECSQLQSKPPSCEREICLATKHGIVTAEGTIDKQKLLNLVEKDMAEFPDIMPALKEKCINGDISQYGLEDECDLIKMRHCMNIQGLGHCPDWDNEGPCKGMEETAKACLKQIIYRLINSLLDPLGYRTVFGLQK